MKYIKQVLGGDLRQYTMVVALGLLILIFNVISDGRMLTSSNFQNLLSGNAYVLVLALGMLTMFAVTACDDSASSGDSNDSGSKSSSISKGSFPPKGDESFYHKWCIGESTIDDDLIM